MKHKAQLTISRPSCSDGSETIRIAVKDYDATITFLEIEIGLKEFAQCITGLSFVDCEMQLRGLKNLGKKREMMDIVFEMPEHTYSNRKEVALKAAQEATPDGWVCSDYFESQDSFFTKDGKDYGKTMAVRWVEK